MKFLNKMEREYGRYAIPNLSKYIVIAYAIGYIISVVNGNLLTWLTLEPALILKGQVWRLISWVLVPNSGLDIFTIITLYFYYSIGNVLERTWGTFRYNVYIFSGILMTVVGGFIINFLLGGIVGYGWIFSTYYISMSIILAFTATYPNAQVLFMMFIPLKMKWLGIFYGIMLVYDLFQVPWLMKIVIICSLMNFIIFFFCNRNIRRFAPKEVRRRNDFRKAVNQGRAQNITTHKCAICGRTEQDGIDLEFRFCSKCNGNYEYCQEHLFTHTHVQ